MTRKVIFLKGLPGSGKTTWAKKLILENPGFYKRISKDDLRSMLDAGKWSRENERYILQMRDRLILEALQRGFSVIVDDTNLEKKHEKTIISLITFYNDQREREEKDFIVFEVNDSFLSTSLEECVKRDRTRSNGVGERVIRRMHRDYLLQKDPPPDYNLSLEDIVICDIDGTLALLGDRDPYDASTCEQDLPNIPIVNLIKSLTGAAYSSRTSMSPLLVLVSGREEKYRKQTESWIDKIGVSYTSLYLRKDGDFRTDSIVKKEMYKEHILSKYNVLWVFDDRNSVVETWRKLGLTCLQVKEGDF